MSISQRPGNNPVAGASSLLFVLVAEKAKANEATNIKNEEDA
jgi:hypothetical protein